MHVNGKSIGLTLSSIVEKQPHSAGTWLSGCREFKVSAIKFTYLQLPNVRITSFFQCTAVKSA